MSTSTECAGVFQAVAVLSRAKVLAKDPVKSLLEEVSPKALTELSLELEEKATLASLKTMKLLERLPQKVLLELSLEYMKEETLKRMIDISVDHIMKNTKEILEKGKKSPAEVLVPTVKKNPREGKLTSSDFPKWGASPKPYRRKNARMPPMGPSVKTTLVGSNPYKLPTKAMPKLDKKWVFASEGPQSGQWTDLFVLTKAFSNGKIGGVSYPPSGGFPPKMQPGKVIQGYNSLGGGWQRPNLKKREAALPYPFRFRVVDGGYVFQERVGGVVKNLDPKKVTSKHVEYFLESRKIMDEQYFARSR